MSLIAYSSRLSVVRRSASHGIDAAFPFPSFVPSLQQSSIHRNHSLHTNRPFSSHAFSTSHSHTQSPINYGLSGRRALITGGSSGIGFAIAALFAQQGVRVAITSRSLAKAADASVKINSLLATGSPSETSTPTHLQTLAIECDVRSSESVNRCFQSLATQWDGQLDIVVNAAGINQDALLTRAKDDMISDILQTNLIGSMYVCRSAAKHMLAQRVQQRRDSSAAATSSSPAPPSATQHQHHPSPRIILIGSIVGSNGHTGQSIYAASKSGLHGLMLSLSQELSSRHITVNCINPGWIRTDMSAAALSRQIEKVKEHEKRNNTKIGSPEDVAHLAAFLASPQAKFINGQIIHVDGGGGSASLH